MNMKDGISLIINVAIMLLVAWLFVLWDQDRAKLDEVIKRSSELEVKVEALLDSSPQGVSVDYPEDLPDEIIALVEAFEPLDGKYDKERIKKAVSDIDDQMLKDLVSSIAWESEAGQELAMILVEKKAISKDGLKLLGSGEIRDLNAFRKCLWDTDCFVAVEKCLLIMKCCILRCRCWPICTTCDICKPCWRYPCCFTGCYSNNIQVGLEEGTGNYITVKKIRFEEGGVLSVSKDPGNSTIAVVTIPSGTGGTSHSHTNQTILDGLTQPDIDSLHVHSNQPAVDNLTQAVVDDYHSHANQAELDNLSQGVIDDSHGHTNQAALDNLSQSVIDHEGITSGNPHDVSKADIITGADLINSADISNDSITSDDLEPGFRQSLVVKDAGGNVAVNGAITVLGDIIGQARVCGSLYHEQGGQYYLEDYNGSVSGVTCP